MQYTAILAVLALASSANAHMALSYPAPFRAKNNPHANQNTIDYSMTSPLSGAAQFPCKGYNVDMDDINGVGASVATWTAGGSANFTVEGGATHGGGSCQVALSYDKGKSFNVIHSYIGSCPLTSGESFDFTIPSDATTGSAMFAWVWYNKIGNREIYMNCASVTIAAGSGSSSAVAFSARPDLFVANLANGCTTVEGKEVEYPNPGPDADVTTKTTGDDSGSFTGTCEAVDGIGGESASGSGSSASGSSADTGATSSTVTSAGGAATSTTLTTSVSTGSAPGGVFVTVSASPGADSSTTATSATSSDVSSSTSSAPDSTGTGSSGTIQVTTNGQCSGSQTCAGQTEFGSCCSQWGYCGDTDLHCGTGCMPEFGSCGTFGNSTTTTSSAGAAQSSTGLRIRGGRWRIPA